MNRIQRNTERMLFLQLIGVLKTLEFIFKGFSFCEFWYYGFPMHIDLMEQILIINGNNFSDEEGFYNEVDQVLTKNPDLKTGHNLNAFNDLLRGGFGVHAYEEPISLKWINFPKSQKDLGEEFTDTVMDIILSHEHVEFLLE